VRFSQTGNLGRNGKAGLPRVDGGADEGSDSSRTVVLGIETPGVTCRWRQRGRRRTRQDQIPPTKKSPMKLRTSNGPHRAKKACFFCRTGFDRRVAPSKFDPAVWPDVSPTPSLRRSELFGLSWVRPAPLQMTCRQQSRRHSDQGELTSSSRPCGSSSQSSSLRSSPSSPS